MGQIEDERIRSESLAWIMLILVCGGLFQCDECTKDANDTKAKQQYVVPPIKEAKITSSAEGRESAMFNVTADPWVNVSVDGQLLGKTPQSVQVEYGTHVFTFESQDGKTRTTDKITFRGEGRLFVTIPLVPD